MDKYKVDATTVDVCEISHPSNYAVLPLCMVILYILCAIVCVHKSNENPITSHQNFTID